MIELPEWAVPNAVAPELIDFGMILRPSTGAEVLRVDRKGSRFRLVVGIPPKTPEQARIIVSRLLKAKKEGLRIAFPLLGVNQGEPGLPVVNATNPIGHVIPVRGLTPGYIGREGYWLSAEDASGRHYLHNVETDFAADGSGNGLIRVTPELRWPFANGARIHLARPMVQGFVAGEAWGWQIPVNKLIAIEFPLEEAA